MKGPVPKRVNVVSDGAQALDYLRRHGAFKDAKRPDLVLLDLNLPKRGGLEVLRDIKGDPRLRSIAVIVLTTSSYAEDVNAAYELLANCYIVKPVDLEDFYSMMESVEEFWMSMASLPTEGRGISSDAPAARKRRMEGGSAHLRARSCGERVRSRNRAAFG